MLRLLLPPTEDKRVATLEPDDRLAFACCGDQSSIDFSLRQQSSLGGIRATGSLCMGRSVPEQQRIDESVIQDQISDLQAGQPPEGQQARITRPCSNEINFANLRRGHLECSRIAIFCWPLQGI